MDWVIDAASSLEFENDQFEPNYVNYISTSFLIQIQRQLFKSFTYILKNSALRSPGLFLERSLVKQVCGFDSSSDHMFFFSPRI